MAFSQYKFMSKTQLPFGYGEVELKDSNAYSEINTILKPQKRSKFPIIISIIIGVLIIALACLLVKKFFFKNNSEPIDSSKFAREYIESVYNDGDLDHYYYNNSCRSTLDISDYSELSLNTDNLSTTDNATIDVDHINSMISAYYQINKTNIKDTKATEFVNSEIDYESIYVITFVFNNKCYVFDAYAHNLDLRKDNEVTLEMDSDEQPIDINYSTENDATENDATTRTSVQEGYKDIGGDEFGYLYVPQNFNETPEDIVSLDDSQGIAFRDDNDNSIFFIKYQDDYYSSYGLKEVAESINSGVCRDESIKNNPYDGLLKEAYMGSDELEDGKIVRVFTFADVNNIYRTIIFVCSSEEQFKEYYDSYRLGTQIMEIDD